jgi:hypothetical protein
MRTLLPRLSPACLPVFPGCAELFLKDLRVEAEAGEAVAEGPDSAAGTGAAGATDAGVGPAWHGRPARTAMKEGTSALRQPARPPASVGSCPPSRDGQATPARIGSGVHEDTSA